MNNVWSSENVQTEILKTIKQLNQDIESFDFNILEENNRIFLKLSKLDNLYNYVDMIINEISEDEQITYENSKKLIISLLCIMCERKHIEYNNVQELKNIIKEVGTLLISKNKKYGNAALNPCRIFSKASKLEQLFVRCDDKLNRIKNRQDDEDEDPIKDLVGYLILILVCVNIEK